MKSLLFPWLLSILAVSGCHQPTQLPPPTDPISAQEYAVLSRLVDTLFICGFDSIIVLRDSTTPGVYPQDIDSTLALVARAIPSTKTDAMRDFKSKNISQFGIINPASICSNCVLSKNTRLNLPYLEVSRVGFSSDSKQALAYVGSVDGPLSGAGYYFVLSWQNRKWVIIDSIMIWIS